MKTGLVGYRISEHGTDIGVVVKRARISHVCDECEAPISPKSVYIEHPIRFGAAMKVHVACAVKLELVEPLPHADVHGNTILSFTPGPWEAHKTHYGDDRTWDVSTPLRTVASVNDGDGRAAYNAKLIAAAPRMFRAITRLTTVVDPEREELAVGFSPKDWTDAMRECREALVSAQWDIYVHVSFGCAQFEEATDPKKESI